MIFPRAFHRDPKEGRDHHVREVMRVAEGDGASDSCPVIDEAWSRLWSAGQAGQSTPPTSWLSQKKDNPGEGEAAAEQDGPVQPLGISPDHPAVHLVGRDMVTLC